MTAWGKPLSGLAYPFCLDSFLAFLGRAPAFWAAFSERSAGFAESRPETTSSKARRSRDGDLRCLPVFFFTCQAKRQRLFLPPCVHGVLPALHNPANAPPYVPYSLRPAGRAVRASSRGIGLTWPRFCTRQSEGLHHSQRVWNCVGRDDGVMSFRRRRPVTQRGMWPAGVVAVHAGTTCPRSAARSMRSAPRPRAG